MSPLLLQEQKEHEFIYKLVIQASHVNYAGHVGYNSMIDMVWEARVHLLHTFGLTELDLGDGETGIITTDLVATFKREAFLFDEITVESHVTEILNNRFRIFHRISTAGELIALVETGFVTFNYKTHKVVPVPKTFVSLIERYKKNHLQRSDSRN
jgi:acyl-CoA thioesterase FadM